MHIKAVWMFVFGLGCAEGTVIATGDVGADSDDDETELTDLEGGEPSSTDTADTASQTDTGEEVDTGDTAADTADADGDGLTDAEEISLGLNPDLVDSDGDGFDDFDEVSEGTDGTDCASVPEGWGDCREQALLDGVSPTGTGFGVSQTLPNFTAADQFDDPLEFHQLYGSVILIDISAGWCGPCRSAAQSAESEYQSWKSQGVEFVHFIYDDASYNHIVDDADFLGNWADQYGLTFPVISDSNPTDGFTYAGGQLLYSNGLSGIPAYIVVDRNMVVRAAWSGHSTSYANGWLATLVAE